MQDTRFKPFVENSVLSFAAAKHDTIVIEVNAQKPRLEFINRDRFKNKYIVGLMASSSRTRAITSLGTNNVNGQIFEESTLTIKAGNNDEVLHAIPLIRLDPSLNGGRAYNVAHLPWNQNDSYISIHSDLGVRQQSALNNESFEIEVYYYDTDYYEYLKEQMAQGWQQ